MVEAPCLQLTEEANNFLACLWNCLDDVSEALKASYVVVPSDLYVVKAT